MCTMRFVRLLPFFLLILSLKWTGDTAIVFLNQQCKDVGMLTKAWNTLKSFFQPKKAPPWWEQLCTIHSGHDLQGYLDTFLIIGFLYLLILALRPAKVRKGKRSRHVQRRNPLTAGIATDRKPIPVSPLPYVLSSKIPLQPDRIKCIDNNNSNTLQPTCGPMSLYTPRLDGFIYIKDKIPESIHHFRSILVGPVTTTFQAIRTVLASTFQLLKIPESELQWSTQKDSAGNISSLRVCSQNILVDVVLVPAEGFNIYVQRLGPARGQLREVYYWCYHVTYRGVVLHERRVNTVSARHQ